MKVAHISPTKRKALTFSECLEKAKEAEMNGNTAEAINAYRKCIKINPTNEYSYDRLMILLRKQKNYEQELDLIKQGIHVFENFYKNSSKIKVNSAIKKLSQLLGKFTGLTDKKGKITFEMQPILCWQKRIDLLQKRLKRSSGERPVIVY